MVHLFDSELIKNKSLFFALLSIYGVGKIYSSLICKKLGVSKNFKTNNLSKEQIHKIVRIIKSLNVKLSSDLKKIRLLNFKKLILIKSYKGLRRNKKLPVRGQRTHTNARTVRKIFLII